MVDNAGRTFDLVSGKPRRPYRLKVPEKAADQKKRDHKIPFFAYRRNPLTRIAAVRVVLLAGVWRVRVKQRTLTILDTNNISRQLRVMVFAKANFTVYTIDVGGHQVVTNSGSFRLDLGGVSSHVGPTHGVCKHIDNVVGGSIDMMGSRFVNAAFFGFIQKLLFELMVILKLNPSILQHFFDQCYENDNLQIL